MLSFSRWFYGSNKTNFTHLPNISSASSSCVHLQKYADNEMQRLQKVQEWLRRSYKLPHASLVDFSSTQTLQQEVLETGSRKQEQEVENKIDK